MVLFNVIFGFDVEFVVRIVNLVLCVIGDGVVIMGMYVF